jgi:hypothetical protein
MAAAAWGRAIRFAVTDAGGRWALREQLSYPPSLAVLIGYVLSAAPAQRRPVPSK